MSLNWAYLGIKNRLKCYPMVKIPLTDAVRKIAVCPKDNSDDGGKTHVDTYYLNRQTHRFTPYLSNTSSLQARLRG